MKPLLKRATALSLGIVFLGLAALAVLTFVNGGKSYTYRYRLTVNVRENGRIISGASVVRVREIPTATGGRRVPRLCGEGTIVDLGGGKFIVATLVGTHRPYRTEHPAPGWTGSPTTILLADFGLPREWPWKDDSGIKQIPNMTKAVVLKHDELPDLITFRNANDPTTIKLLDSSDLSVDLGTGVEFVSATVQVTDAAITRGKMEKYFPWFKESEEYLDGSQWGQRVDQTHSYELARCVWFRSF